MEEHGAFPHDPALHAFISCFVVEEGEPLTRVIHESDGGWMFRGPTRPDSEDDCLLVSIHDIQQRYPEVLAVADLEVGWFADLSDGGTWSRSRLSLLPSEVTHDDDALLAIIRRLRSGTLTEDDSERDLAVIEAAFVHPAPIGVLFHSSSTFGRILTDEEVLAELRSYRPIEL